MATYDIDLLRALMVHKLNDQSIFLASFYEQIQSEDEINRYVETIKELVSLQNNEKSESGYKAMGIISQSGNADILNIKQNYIAPLEYQVRLDIELSDRDYVLGKIKTLINDLKGTKNEVIALQSGEIIVANVPTIDTATDKISLTEANKTMFAYAPSYDPRTATTAWSTDLEAKYNATSTFATIEFYFYYVPDGKLYKRSISRTSGTYTYGTVVDLDLVEERYKISVSFNGIQSQEPYINNGVDRVFLFFGGNATIVDRNVILGNDIIRTTIRVGKDEGITYTVEPTELTGSLDVSDDTYPLWSTGYQSVDRNMAISNKVSYSFVFDRSNVLFEGLYKYGRYGSGSGTYAQQIFTVTEYRYTFGNLFVDRFYAKLGNVNTQNTNGDVMTISVLFKVGAY